MAMGAGVYFGNNAMQAMGSAERSWFDISLAQWSLHRAFRGGELDPMDFAKITRKEFGIDAVEYVNSFYMDKLTPALVKDLKTRAEGEGVRSLLIMCDRLGQLGAPKQKARIQTVEKHKVWIDAAKELGCHSIRVNAGSSGTYEEQMDRAADGLSRLNEVGKAAGIGVIVENHGGLSSNGAWLSAVIRKVGDDNCGTLPDFGNFRINRKTGETYDRYKGTEELMPFAKGVSAKSHDFDADGMEANTDYPRMMKIVKDAGFRGYVGIEYEGKELGEFEGIRATKALLEKLGGRGA
ncbi:MAG: sugar phosphate isomerase/epimerase family protein [Verrucomicrobiota bacterium]